MNILFVSILILYIHTRVFWWFSFTFFACNLRRCLFSLLGSGGIHWALVTSSNRPLGEEGGASCPSVHISLALCRSPLPSPTLTWALPLAERWDSFTEAAGCQERASPRKAGQMYVGHCESEGGFSFSYSLLFSPPFCSRVLFLSLFVSLARSIHPHEWNDNTDLCQSRLLFSWTSS